MTAAPARTAASATAKPIFPELRLPMKRTGSRSSKVGPALTSTRRPASSGGAAGAASAATISTGSAMRPAPSSPQAWLPVPGPTSVAPRDTSVATLVRVAGCAHIAWFIAGASTSGARLARHNVVTRSSAMPAASRAISPAVAGAITMRSAQRASSMWPIAASAAGSHSDERTGWPESAWKVVGPTNSRAASVITTRTSAPASRRRRTRSAAL